MSRHALSLAAALLAGCPRGLTLPPSAELPVIAGFFPQSAFMDDIVVVDGAGFAPDPEANEVRFPDGRANRALDGSTTVRLRVLVPQGVESAGPLQVATPAGTSQPSADDFYPLGAGHPVLGLHGEQVTFRHQPVGLADYPDFVVVASMLLDAVVGGPVPVPLNGSPVALLSGPGALVTVSVQSASGGSLALVDPLVSAPIAVSEAAGTVEQFVLAARPGTAQVARSIGRDTGGAWWLSEWDRTGGELRAQRRRVEATQVLGAATDSAGEAFLVARHRRSEGEPTGLLVLAASGAQTDRWRELPWAEKPVGPVAFFDAPSGATAAVALDNGDIGLLGPEGTEPSRLVTLSLEPAADLVAVATGAGPRVVIVKTLERGVFSWDPLGRTLEWSVPLQGRPVRLAAAVDGHGVLVANETDNDVDFVRLSDGRWEGRVPLHLGLGSADGGEGGVVPAYSYRQDAPERPQEMLVLARDVERVLALDVNRLAVTRRFALDAGAGRAVRLALSPDDLVPFVVHEHALGVLDDSGVERVLAPALPKEPRGLRFLPGALVAIGSEDTVELYEYDIESAVLSPAGGFALPAGAALAALIPSADATLALWSDPENASLVAGALLHTDELRARRGPTVTRAADRALAGLLGAFDHVYGTLLLFAASQEGGPAAVVLDEALRETRRSVSEADRPAVTGLTPDRRYLVWQHRTPGGDALTLLGAWGPDRAITQFGSYRLPAPVAGAGFDPSGEWCFAPVPALDTVLVLY